MLNYYHDALPFHSSFFSWPLSSNSMNSYHSYHSYHRYYYVLIAVHLETQGDDDQVFTIISFRAPHFCGLFLQQQQPNNNEQRVKVFMLSCSY